MKQGEKKKVLGQGYSLLAACSFTRESDLALECIFTGLLIDLITLSFGGLLTNGFDTEAEN